MTVVLVALGGGIGSLLRWLVSASIPRSSNGFPLAITVVNVSGSLALGVVFGLIASAPVSSSFVPLSAGLLGGFTTYSTWMVDVEGAREGRETARTISIPLVLGLSAAAIGLWIGSTITG